LTPYEQLAALALEVRREGFDELSTSLLEAHKGIFNGTELFIVWRFNVEKVIAQEGLSVGAREKAESIWRMLDQELQ
jgi:hypothetical protein